MIYDDIILGDTIMSKDHGLVVCKDDGDYDGNLWFSVEEDSDIIISPEGMDSMSEYELRSYYLEEYCFTLTADEVTDE